MWPAGLTRPGIINPESRVLLRCASGLSFKLSVRKLRMKIAQIVYGMALSLVGFYSFPAQADVALESKADIVGVWKLEGSAKDLDSPRRPGEQIWEFKDDGTLATSGYDKRLPGGNFAVDSHYEIVDGKIVADVVGRPGRKTSYTVIEKDGNSMIIRQEMGEYMFFIKK
jgi:hypothetical protein